MEQSRVVESTSPFNVTPQRYQLDRRPSEGMLDQAAHTPDITGKRVKETKKHFLYQRRVAQRIANGTLEFNILKDDPNSLKMFSAPPDPHYTMRAQHDLERVLDA